MSRFEVRPTTDLCGTQRETKNDSSHIQRSAFTYLCFCDSLLYDCWMGVMNLIISPVNEMPQVYYLARVMPETK